MLCLLESCALFAVWFTNDTAMIFSVAVHAGDRRSSTRQWFVAEEVNSSPPQSFSALFACLFCVYYVHCDFLTMMQ
jgi:hypothetical protein